jgi:tetratricopeptide (TPR) repeat protein
MKLPAQATPNARLRHARQAKGWTQAELARRLGESGSALSVYRWERGITSPQPHHRRQLCAVLERTPEELGLDRVEEDVGAVRPLDAGGKPDVLTPVAYAATTPPVSAGALVGRDAELTLLAEMLVAGGSLAIAALDGMPGVGKSALAIALANDPAIIAHFSDGVLWAGLGPEAHVPSVMRRWGAALGIPAPELERQTGTAALGELLQTTIASRRILLIVDDAWTAADALALQVGGAGCAHLLTTRFADVAARFSRAAALTIHELDEEQGLALLERLAPEVVRSEPQEARSLVHAVGGLPLALTIMGRYLRVESRSGQPRRIKAALTRLADAGERLRLEDQPAPREYPPSLPSGALLSLRAAISVSDQRLPPHVRAALRALAVFPAKPNTFSEEAARAVTAAPPAILDSLTDSGLLESASPGRYTLHQTIADFARLHADEAGDLAAAQHLAEYFADYVQTHMGDYAQLDREVENALAALEAANTQTLDRAQQRLATNLAPYLEARGAYALAQLHLERAQAAAITLRDEAGQALGLLHLGRLAELQGDLSAAHCIYDGGAAIARKAHAPDILSTLLGYWGGVEVNRGEFAAAEALLLEGLALARELGQRQRTALILRTLGEVADAQGNFERGDALYREALALAQEIDDYETVSACMQNLGTKAAKRGDYALADVFFMKGLGYARRIGHRQRMSALLCNLGIVAIWEHRLADAEGALAESVALARAIKNPIRASNALQNLGILESERGDYPAAEAYFREGLQIARDMGHRWLVGETLCMWGMAQLKQEMLGAAEATLIEALEVAGAMSADFVALAEYGLARVAAAREDYERADHYGQESYRRFTQEGHEKAAEVGAWLEQIARWRE